MLPLKRLPLLIYLQTICIGMDLQSLFCMKKNIQVPGIKTFLSVPMLDTEKSEFKYIAVLEETADQKRLFCKSLISCITNLMLAILVNTLLL